MKQSTYEEFQGYNDSSMLRLSFEGLSRACTDYKINK